MNRIIISTYVLCISCFLVKTQAQTTLDCAALQKKVTTALTESSTTRLSYWSSNRKIYADFEEDAQKNQHLFVRETTKGFSTLAMLSIGGKTLFATSDVSKQDKKALWKEKEISNFNHQAWLDSCFLVKTAMNQPFDKCSLEKDVKITGIPFAIYAATKGADTFRIWINKTEDKIVRIYGGNQQKDTKYSLEFNTPFAIVEPPKEVKDKPNVGFSNFPPSYSLEEYYDGDELVYTAVDKIPEYQKGVADMFKFIGANIHYPETARKNNIEGTIYIGFVVEKDGKISNFKLKRGVDPELNEEAMRVLKLMSGSWLAGIYQDKKVRVAYTLPIKFKLE